MGFLAKLGGLTKSTLKMLGKSVVGFVDVVSGGRISDRENQKSFSNLRRKESDLKRNILLFQNNFDDASKSAVLSINMKKGEFCTAKFPRFQKLTTSISCWKIYYKKLDEKISDLPSFNIEEVRSKDDLFTLDFDEHWFRDSVRAVICPPWAYLQAQKTKDNINNAKMCLKNEEEKWKAEKLRLKKIQEYIQFISEIFEELESFYERLLNELEYSIIMMESTIMLQQSDSFGFCDTKIDLYFMPKHHIDCLMAAEKTTRVVCDLTSRHYLMPPTKEAPGLQLNSKYCEFANEAKIEFQKLKKHLYEFPKTA